MAYKRRKKKPLLAAPKKSLVFKGVPYRSNLEVAMAMCLDEAKIKFKYEAETITLVEGFKFQAPSYERPNKAKKKNMVMKDRGNKKIKPISYTPDFKGDFFYIETKGYANESFPMRWKLFKKWLSENKKDVSRYALYKPQSPSECKMVAKLIKERQSDEN